MFSGRRALKRLGVQRLWKEEREDGNLDCSCWRREGECWVLWQRPSGTRNSVDDLAQGCRRSATGSQRYSSNTANRTGTLCDFSLQIWLQHEPAVAHIISTAIRPPQAAIAPPFVSASFSSFECHLHVGHRPCHLFRPFGENGPWSPDDARLTHLSLH
jgi:hypothetical protein